MRNFFGYIRVSTAKQGERGVSLQEQRESISRYAEQHGLSIEAWFEERETAAKCGRPVFAQMLKLLRNGNVQGVVIHKIDRSARNLRDWADLGELIDRGIEIHFTNESLDLHSRGGRLSADIQAVVAADYIRNLREETRKGFYGRLKQGLYPLPAPLGYLDKGPGHPKELDPVRAPLVREAFQLYASGRYPLDVLNEELFRRGLRNRGGRRITRTGLSVLLNNPFYAGVIRLKRTGDTFPGTHVPLVSTVLFQQVQNILRGRTPIRERRHEFPFRRLLSCATCGRSLVASRQKGYVYYRCQTKTCPTTSIREDVVDAAILRSLEPLRFDPREMDYFKRALRRLRLDRDTARERETAAIHLQSARLETRMNRLIDAYVDGALDKDTFQTRKVSLLLEQQRLREKAAMVGRDQRHALDLAQKILERAKTLYPSYQIASVHEKREIVEIATSNRVVRGKNVDIELNPEHAELAKRPKTRNGTPYRDTARTLEGFLAAVVMSSPPLDVSDVLLTQSRRDLK